MQRNTTQFGVVAVANSSCMHLDLDLCSSFSYDVVSVLFCPMQMYMLGKRSSCMQVCGNVSMTFLHNHTTESDEILSECRHQ